MISSHSLIKSASRMSKGRKKLREEYMNIMPKMIIMMKMIIDGDLFIDLAWLSWCPDSLVLNHVSC